MSDLSPTTSDSDDGTVNQPSLIPSTLRDHPTDGKRKLSKDCQRKAHLDGKFFAVDLENSVKEGQIIAICKFFNPTCRIKGTPQSSTNFLQHLKVRAI